MPSTSRQLEGISNLAYQDDFPREQTSTPRVRISSSTMSEVASNRQRSNTVISRPGPSQVPASLPLSPSLLVSNNPNGGVTVVFIENDRNSQTITPPVTPNRKRAIPPWLRRSLAQSHHSPYSLWPSLTQREMNPLPSQHNVRIRSCNTSNISPRLSSVSTNPWRRSTSSMPSRFM